MKIRPTQTAWLTPLSLVLLLNSISAHAINLSELAGVYQPMVPDHCGALSGAPAGKGEVTVTVIGKSVLAKVTVDPRNDPHYSYVGTVIFKFLNIGGSSVNEQEVSFGKCHKKSTTASETILSLYGLNNLITATTHESYAASSCDATPYETWVLKEKLYRQVDGDLGRGEFLVYDFEQFKDESLFGSPWTSGGCVLKRLR